MLSQHFLVTFDTHAPNPGDDSFDVKRAVPTRCASAFLMKMFMFGKSHLPYVANLLEAFCGVIILVGFPKHKQFFYSLLKSACTGVNLWASSTRKFVTSSTIILPGCADFVRIEDLSQEFLRSIAGAAKIFPWFDKSPLLEGAANFPVLMMRRLPSNPECTRGPKRGH